MAEKPFAAAATSSSHPSALVSLKRRQARWLPRRCGAEEAEKSEEQAIPHLAGRGHPQDAQNCNNLD